MGRPSTRAREPRPHRRRAGPDAGRRPAVRRAVDRRLRPAGGDPRARTRRSSSGTAAPARSCRGWAPRCTPLARGRGVRLPGRVPPPRASGQPAGPPRHRGRGLDRGAPEHLEAGGRFPEWTDAELAEPVPDDAARAALVEGDPRPQPRLLHRAAAHRRRRRAGRLAGRAVRLPACVSDVREPGRIAQRRGWPVVEHLAGHFAALVDPDGTAAALETSSSRPCGTPS